MSEILFASTTQIAAAIRAGDVSAVDSSDQLAMKERQMDETTRSHWNNLRSMV